mgnify:FL=1|tara:strand:+ start:382 stop:1812 length:1431 start_codon:yes stop_codon:yes gene_type:complete
MKRRKYVQNLKKLPQEIILETTSTLPQHGLVSGAAWIASADVAVKDKFLNELSVSELLALPYLFEFWALPHQVSPSGAWRTWVIMGGRGAGKTRAGAEWVRHQVEGATPLMDGKARRMALVADTLEQARDVMVFGESGILACSPPDRRPVWQAARKRLLWPNGATATVFSAHDPEALRGPQFDAAWCDELAKWKQGQAAWDNLQFALRLGDEPRQCVTTTPRNVGVLKTILGHSSTVKTHAPTAANQANLADSFLAEVHARYAGTRLGRQELDGLLIEGIEGGLWTEKMLSIAQVDIVPELDRVIVAIDPPVTGHSKSDDCGIIVAGAVTSGPMQDWRAYVLADATISGSSPTKWATAAVAALDRWGAERLVAEVNQGGDLVETVVRQVAPMVPYRAVRAGRGKAARAEPVAALYEQGKVYHAKGLDKLEEQMSQMTAQGYHGSGSPDRVDALVWALSDLLLDPAAQAQPPSLRVL